MEEKHMKKKLLASVVAIALVACCVIGGTLAWLTDKTDPVVNTFTVGDVNIDLDESDDLDLKIVPGKEITKDPVVTVEANSEKCYLFVKIDKEHWNDKMTYEVADGWTELETGVYYRTVESSETAQPFQILAGDKVTVANTLTKDEIETMKTNAPKLTFTAYAVQFEGMTDVNAAWTAAQANA